MVDRSFRRCVTQAILVPSDTPQQDVINPNESTEKADQKPSLPLETISPKGQLNPFHLDQVVADTRLYEGSSNTTSRSTSKNPSGPVLGTQSVTTSAAYTLPKHESVESPTSERWRGSSTAERRSYGSPDTGSAQTPNICGILKVYMNTQENLGGVADLLQKITVDGQVIIDYKPPAAFGVSAVGFYASKKARVYESHEERIPTRSGSDCECSDRGSPSESSVMRRYWQHIDGNNSDFEDPNIPLQSERPPSDHETRTERPLDLESILDAAPSSQTVGVSLPGVKHEVAPTIAFIDSGAIGRQANLVSRRFLQEELNVQGVSGECRSVVGLGAAAFDSCGEIQLKLWPRSPNPRTGCIEQEPPLIQSFLIIDDTQKPEGEFFGDILLGQRYSLLRGRSFNASFIVSKKKSPAHETALAIASIRRQHEREEFERSQQQSSSSGAAQPQTLPANSAANGQNAQQQGQNAP